MISKKQSKLSELSCSFFNYYSWGFVTLIFYYLKKAGPGHRPEIQANYKLQLTRATSSRAAEGLFDFRLEYTISYTMYHSIILQYNVRYDHVHVLHTHTLCVLKTGQR